MLHRSSWLLLLFAIALAACQENSSNVSDVQANQSSRRKFSPLEKAQLDDYVSFPSVGVKIQKPSGFEKSDTFDGFAQKATNSSILILQMPGPFPEISAAFTAEKLGEKGMKLLEKQAAEVGDESGILIHMEQSAFNTTFEKWSLVFGDERRTTLVTATFPKADAGKLSTSLKAAVLSTRLVEIADPTSTIPFTLADTSKLKLAASMGRAATYSIDGKFPVKDVAEPIFIAATSLGNFFTFDQRSAVEKQLRTLEHIRSYAITTQTEINIDGLGGLESIVHSNDSSSGRPMGVYHVMLFGDNFYYVLIGIVTRDRFDEFLPEFRALSQSLKRKNVPGEVKAKGP